ncbi:hypothetical protein KL935_002937 [Ogataea polymorpha]|nr:hypothetical protein KL935_002937 [Ogataea polymorpha]
MSSYEFLIGMAQVRDHPVDAKAALPRVVELDLERGVHTAVSERDQQEVDLRTHHPINYIASWLERFGGLLIDLLEPHDLEKRDNNDINKANLERCHNRVIGHRNAIYHGDVWHVG